MYDRTRLLDSFEVNKPLDKKYVTMHEWIPDLTHSQLYDTKAPHVRKSKATGGRKRKVAAVDAAPEDTKASAAPSPIPASAQIAREPSPQPAISIAPSIADTTESHEPEVKAKRRRVASGTGRRRGKRLEYGKVASELELSDDEVMPSGSATRTRKAARIVRHVKKEDILNSDAALSFPMSQRLSNTLPPLLFNDTPPAARKVAAAPPIRSTISFSGHSLAPNSRPVSPPAGAYGPASYSIRQSVSPKRSPGGIPTPPKDLKLPSIHTLAAGLPEPKSGWGLTNPYLYQYTSNGTPLGEDRYNHAPAYPAYMPPYKASPPLPQGVFGIPHSQFVARLSTAHPGENGSVHHSPPQQSVAQLQTSQ